MCIQSLYLEENILKDFGMVKLCRLLEDNDTLTFINVFANKFGEAGASAIAAMIRKNSKLEVCTLLVCYFRGWVLFRCTALKARGFHFCVYTTLVRTTVVGVFLCAFVCMFVLVPRTFQPANILVSTFRRQRHFNVHFYYHK